MNIEMEMDEKESTDSGSMGLNSDSESPRSSGGDFSGLGVEAGNERLPDVEKGEGVFNSGVAVGVGGPGGGGGGNGEMVVSGKKKRGRPRKYDENGNLRPSYMKPPPEVQLQPGFTLSTPSSYPYSSGAKRGRGKHHLGSSSWKFLDSLGELLSNTAGGDFTPHVVTVQAGEDVAGKIVTFAQKGPGGICVLSANGSVSNVTLRLPGSSGGLLSYEGRFEILTLSGSYTICENGKMKSQTGGLSVSLASSDGRVIGGGVAGMLMAANPIQVVVGSFVPNVMKLHKRKQNNEPKTSTPPVPAVPATVTAAVPLSTFPTQIQGAADNSLSSKDNNPNTALTDTAHWIGSGQVSFLQKSSPDINLSIQVDEH